MLKQFTAWVVLVAILVSVILLPSSSGANATDTSPWINSALSFQKQADTQTPPASLNGNIDCTQENAIDCAVTAAYGTATQNGTVRLNGTNKYLPINNYIEDRPRFIPVPNSNEVISYTTEPAYGFYLYFNYNLSNSIQAQEDFSGQHYKITRSPDGVLADKTNQRLAADYGSISFSQSGQWMIVSDPNAAMLRVNLSNFEVLPFAPGFNYTIGIDPSLKTAISNDGRYAAVASQGFNSWRVYDLATCPILPNSITTPVACQSRDIKSFVDSQLPGFSSSSYIRFIDDNSLSSYINYKAGSVSKTARVIISDQNIANQIEYLAMGDSYISGEGSFDYQSVTDTADNHCHLSSLSYPYLIGKDLNFNSYKSVACSGAVTGDVIDTAIPFSGKNKVQAKGKDESSFDDEIYSNFLPGYRAQVNFVERYQPKIITLSIGGDDMGFSDTLKACVIPSKTSSTCYNTYEDRLELVNHINRTVYPRLVQTYQQIKSASPPDTRIYIIGYPQVAKPDGDCALNVHFNNDEIKFSQQLITYLDAVVKTAAAKIGVYYVDTQDALNGHRLCEAGPGSVAVNGLTAGNDSPGRLGGPIGSESYHPNQLGYELLENKILASTHNLTAPMPNADINNGLFSVTDQDILNVPRSNRQIKSIELDDGLTEDLAFQGVPLNISINGAAHSLAPGSSIQTEIHSDPVNLGIFSLDQAGSLSTSLIIPNSVPAGYHTLHFYSTDISGRPVDIYKYIYVASTADDLDGNGIIDASQGCVSITNSGQDHDQDGIDDACDANISQPSATPASLTFAGPASDSTTSQSVSGKSGSIGRDTILSNSNPNHPKVLSAMTTRQNQNGVAGDTGMIRVPDSDLVYGGLAVLLISALAWAIF